MTGYLGEIFFPKNDLNVRNDQRHRTSSQRVKKINVRCTGCLRAFTKSKLFRLSNTFAFLHLIGKGFIHVLKSKKVELKNYIVERYSNEK